MISTAFVFPGQGSQRAGMGAELASSYQFTAEYFSTSDDIVGFPLSRLCCVADAETLRDTAVTQPAIFLVSVITMRALREHGVEPAIAAGHSLGEFAALVCAGVLDWTDALALVHLRGRLMAGVAAREAGAMAAVVGLDVRTVETLCAEVADATGQVVEVANDNAPDQVVVSGHTEAVALATRRALAQGAVRAVPLPVGAPFHCSLMRDIENEFCAAVAEVDVRPPRLTLVSSVTASRVHDAEFAREVLRRQLTGRVRWTDTVTEITGSGAEHLVEVGPGRVLSKLCRRIAPGLPVLPTATDDELRTAARTLGLVPIAPLS
ncbi:ACP S-malonyltransferase [Nocardia sp. 004]|uniref:ACP S-malonyltransferase n=1 Tax=Nocardia sp. 004 TaxID=3385978 RepID=UPI00399FF427